MHAAPTNPASTHTVRTRRRLTGIAAAVSLGAVAAAALVGVSPANASGKTSTGGDYTVTVNGTTTNPAVGKDFKVKGVAVSGSIKVRGKHNGFDIRIADLGVYDYTLTGAADTQRMVTKPTVVFASKVPSLTAGQLAGAELASLDVKDDTLVAIFSTSLGKYKIQAKDGAQGGVFQMETEFAGPVTFTHTLGAGLFYFTNPYTGKINFGDGVAAVASGSGSHQMLLGKDSPQVATKTSQTATTTTWTVQPGGRLGGVLGEDAVELSQGATNCTSDCQAQNQIRGSLPVPPDPVNPTPLVVAVR
ncbi:MULTISPECIES: hypothetical protein [unclassified Curtobacterium]|uniref:hypothetical protein n=1 Tax=unclassified Curtobacterium TaxID=257496 RepID=UPI0010501C30|nr:MULTISPECIES: hypothetical protein [unclassified Curtobacterium]TCL75354.1 hypothetical protein EDF23_11033 [Curtobacterium sp. PhB128]TCL92170.1 hypothetical protein EDF29_109111 [Curtobacterium sp. PhB138]